MNWPLERRDPLRIHRLKSNFRGTLVFWKLVEVY